MKNIFFSSDHHFGHENCWAKFKNADGSPLRPFTSTEEMNETLIERHNSKVRPGDHVYMLGDVAINKKYLELVKRLNGKKRLIRGNHDIFADSLYRDVGFEKIYGVRVFVDKWVLSHIPLHPDCVTERFRVNLHGHLHGNRVMRQSQVPELRHIQEIDPRYLSCCVEQIDYTPLHFDEVEERIQKQWTELNYTPPNNAGWGNGSGPE